MNKTILAHQGISVSQVGIYSDFVQIKHFGSDFLTGYF